MELTNLGKLHMKSSRILTALYNIFSQCIQNHTKMPVCIFQFFWLIENVQILRNDLDVILYSTEKKYKRNLLVEKFPFLYSCAYVLPPLPHPLTRKTLAKRHILEYVQGKCRDPVVALACICECAMTNEVWGEPYCQRMNH